VTTAVIRIAVTFYTRRAYSVIHIGRIFARVYGNKRERLVLQSNKFRSTVQNESPLFITSDLLEYTRTNVPRIRRVPTVVRLGNIRYSVTKTAPSRVNASSFYFPFARSFYTTLPLFIQTWIYRLFFKIVVDRNKRNGTHEPNVQ